MSNTDAHKWLESHLHGGALRSGKSNTNRDSSIAPAHANSNRYVYCDADGHTETFTDAETGANAQAASHAATAPVTSSMKKKHTAQSGSFSLQLVLCSAAVCSMITGTLLAFFHPEAPAKASHPAARD